MHRKIDPPFVEPPPIVSFIHWRQNNEEGGTKVDKTAMREKIKNRRQKKNTVKPSSLPTNPRRLLTFLTTLNFAKSTG